MKMMALELPQLLLQSDRRRFSFRGIVRGRGRGRERLPPFVRGGVATAAATTAVVATAPHVTAPLAAAATTDNSQRLIGYIM